MALRNKELSKNQKIVLDYIQKCKKPVKAYSILSNVNKKGLKAPPQVYRALDKLIEIGEVHNGNFKTDPEDVSISIDESGSYTVEKMKLGTTGTVVRMFMLRVKQ